MKWIPFLLWGSSSVDVLVSNNKKKPDFIVAAYSFPIPSMHFCIFAGPMQF